MSAKYSLSLSLALAFSITLCNSVNVYVPYITAMWRHVLQNVVFFFFSALIVVCAVIFHFMANSLVSALFPHLSVCNSNTRFYALRFSVLPSLYHHISHHFTCLFALHCHVASCVASWVKLHVCVIFHFNALYCYAAAVSSLWVECGHELYFQWRTKLHIQLIYLLSATSQLNTTTW